MNDTPNPVPSYLAGIVRTALGFGAGWLVSKGYFSAEQTSELVGAGVVLVTGLWSLFQKWNAHKALKAA
jgi:hypothetical protein